jgi:hypothetical protein
MRSSKSQVKVKVPKNVAEQAELGLYLRKAGFVGGTNTGWNRALQLSTEEKIPIEELRKMKAWFARHGPDASNGGTSYPGYKKWILDGKPTKLSEEMKARDYRGAVAWLLWGGNSAYNWVKDMDLIL